MQKLAMITYAMLLQMYIYLSLNDIHIEMNLFFK